MDGPRWISARKFRRLEAKRTRYYGLTFDNGPFSPSDFSKTSFFQTKSMVVPCLSLQRRACDCVHVRFGSTRIQILCEFTDVKNTAVRPSGWVCGFFANNEPHAIRAEFFSFFYSSVALLERITKISRTASSGRGCGAADRFKNAKRDNRA